MKLLFCESCGDLFNLRRELKKCSCGKVAGRYINDTYAQITKDSISIGIGSGSFRKAIYEMNQHFSTTNGKAPRESYYQAGKGKIEYAWIRPNNGKGNPHCEIVEF